MRPSNRNAVFILAASPLLAVACAARVAAQWGDAEVTVLDPGEPLGFDLENLPDDVVVVGAATSPSAPPLSDLSWFPEIPQQIRLLDREDAPAEPIISERTEYRRWNDPHHVSRKSIKRHRKRDFRLARR